MAKVEIISTVNHAVSVNVPDLRFSRTWSGAGVKVSVEKELLEELMYDIGFRNMVEMGILYIKDLKVKKELGLEPEDAVEPENIILLSKEEKERLLTGISIPLFKIKIAKLSKEQLFQLCDYAIELKTIDLEKAKLLKEACGRDILKAISLQQD